MLIDGYEFITFKQDDAEFVFSTSKNNLNFNKNLEKGKNNLKLLSKYFNLKNIGYVNQIHSSIIQEYDEIVNKDGDAIITNKKDIGIGVFTADCVPVLIYDKCKKACAAIHSGWKGTYKNICGKAIECLANKYGSKMSDLVIYIGPHNRKCCYEFGENIAHKYFGEYINRDNNVYINNKLNLEKCIIMQIMDKGVSIKNINTINLCTYCSREYEFYSYRKDKYNSDGRMFSFVVIHSR